MLAFGEKRTHCTGLERFQQRTCDGGAHTHPLPIARVYAATPLDARGISGIGGIGGGVACARLLGGIGDEDLDLSLIHI